ncbi:hypothetical protein [Paenibacillus sp. FSL H7-0714]|uniref:hypothetical protein n=1 Tax=Paenibacillus sp. FSL H7-0714 TaxID=2954735 RepID=UPI0030F5CE29
MHYEYLAILGERNVQLFGDYFPIRFDYLDTIEGDNLSCQVHPKQSYIRSEFNEFMEQQESYYIMEKKGTSHVYLGLTDTCTEENFYQAVKTAQKTAIPIPLKDYVNEFEAEKGDLFLIPTGTMHASGKKILSSRFHQQHGGLRLKSMISCAKEWMVNLVRLILITPFRILISIRKQRGCRRI